MVPLVPLVLAGPVSTLLAAAADARARPEPPARPAGGRVIPGGLREHELGIAADIVATWGGELHGGNGWPGVDAFLEGRPVILKRHGEPTPSGVPGLVDRAEEGARKAGHSGVDLYVDARDVPTRGLLEITDRLAATPGRGVVRRILVRTADGWFLMPGAVP